MDKEFNNNPIEKDVKVPNRDSLRKEINRMTGQTEQTSEERILHQISERVTNGLSQADSMRVETYLADLMRIITKRGEKDDQELLEEIKGNTSYIGLNKDIEVSDDTTIAFMHEMEQKLADESKSEK